MTQTQLVRNSIGFSGSYDIFLFIVDESTAYKYDTPLECCHTSTQDGSGNFPYLFQIPHQWRNGESGTNNGKLISQLILYYLKHTLSFYDAGLQH